MVTGSELAVPESPHIALFPSPGLGHLIPFINLAKCLVSPLHGFTVTLITAESYNKTQQSLLSSLPPSITTITLPPPDITDTSQHPVITMHLSMLNSVPILQETLKTLKSSARLVVFITDFFGVDLVNTVHELGVPFFLFFPTNLMTVSFFLHLPTLDRTTLGEFKDLPELVKLPGCIPVQGKDLGGPVQDRKSNTYQLSIHITNRIGESDGILANSFYEIEPETVSFFEENEPGWPPVYPIGPLVRSGLCGDTEGDEHLGSLEWLDRQPTRSVLFVSFGSGGTLTSEQTTELAWGLEQSWQRFIWVVRNPSDKRDAALFGTEGSSSGEDPYNFLPQGFVERNRELGFFIPYWAPQIKVLSHNSIGGFLTHCGWNSVLESIMNGVPMIAWPLYAEQHLNAVMLSEWIGVALRPEAREDWLMPREEIARIVRELMEGEGGEKAREKVREMKVAGERALFDQGACFKILEKWKNTIL